MQQSAYQPQPDPKHNKRRTAAEKGEQSLLGPDGLRAINLNEQERREPPGGQDAAHPSKR